MCVNVRRAVPGVCHPTAPLPHGLQGSGRKTLLSQPAWYVALDAKALFLHTYSASSKKNLLCTRGLAGVLRKMAYCKRYTENVVILKDLQCDILPLVGCSLLHGLLCFGLLSLQKYFINHTLIAAIHKKTPVMQKYRTGCNSLCW